MPLFNLMAASMLTHAGSISQAIAQEKMALEYEKYREGLNAQQRKDSLLELERALKAFQLREASKSYANP